MTKVNGSNSSIGTFAAKTGIVGFVGTLSALTATKPRATFQFLSEKMGDLYTAGASSLSSAKETTIGIIKGFDQPLGQLRDVVLSQLQDLGRVAEKVMKSTSEYLASGTGKTVCTQYDWKNRLCLEQHEITKGRQILGYAAMAVAFIGLTYAFAVFANRAQEPKNKVAE